jgi:hypothetical protein
MIGPGQDVPAEGPRGIACDRFGQKSTGRGDQSVSATGGLSDDGRRDGQSHPPRLAVEGGQGSDPIELALQEGSSRGSPEAAGDVGHDFDEMAQEERAGIWSLGDLIEDGVEGGGIDHPAQSDPGHDSRGGPVGERIENRGQRPETSWTERANPVRPKRL